MTPETPAPAARSVLRPDAATLGAFGVLVVLLAANPLAVRFTDLSLPPFFAAATRIGGASLLFFAYVAVRRIALPTGRGLRGAILYGVLQFGFGFGLGYWALVKVPANVAGVILAAIPLFTLVFAAAARLERLTLRGVAGALLSIAGIAITAGAHIGTSVPWPYLIACVGFTACLAGGLIIAKVYREVPAAAMNAVGMLVGAVILVAASLLAREPWTLPSLDATWAVQTYVTVAGSVGAFAIMLYVLRRWTATAVSYQTVLSPPITVALAAWLLGEPVSGGLAVGAVIVLAGVYVGALSGGRTRREPCAPACP